MEGRNIRPVSIMPTKLRQHHWSSQLPCGSLAKRITNLKCQPKFRVADPNLLPIASRHRCSTIRDSTHFTTRSIAITIVPSSMTTHRTMAKVHRLPIRLPRILTAISSRFPQRLAAKTNQVNQDTAQARVTPLGVALISECDIQEKLFVGRWTLPWC
jgi:hypothetical protein